LLHPEAKTGKDLRAEGEIAMGARIAELICKEFVENKNK
jgi:hypothetical protein